MFLSELLIFEELNMLKIHRRIANATFVALIAAATIAVSGAGSTNFANDNNSAARAAIVNAAELPALDTALGADTDTFKLLANSGPGNDVFAATNQAAPTNAGLANVAVTKFSRNVDAHASANTASHRNFNVNRSRTTAVVIAANGITFLVHC